MPAAPLLSDQEIDGLVRTLHGWHRDGEALVKRFTLRDFADAVAFVDRLVAPADDLNHHPDVLIHWNEVTLRLWTHASGGITERDISLASTIDRLTEG